MGALGTEVVLPVTATGGGARPGADRPAKRRPGPADPHGPRVPGAPAPAADPEAAATAGLSAREYHARYGSRIPFVDAAALQPSAKAHPEAALLPLPFPARARAGFHPDTPAGIGDLLALAYGVTRIDWCAGGIRAGRPLPSGGGVYPGELYLAAGFGLCHYLPTAHALEQLDAAPGRGGGGAGRVARRAPPPALVLVFTSRHEANLAVFGAFGHRLQALDSGVLAGQALALVEAAGAEGFVHSRFDAARLGALLGLDPDAESVRAVVTAGRADAEPGAVPAFSTDPGALRAGLPRRIMARHTAREGFEPISVPLPRVLEILDSAALPIPGDLRPGRAAEPTGPTLEAIDRLELYCVANRVDGLAPACHRRNPASGELHEIGGAGTAGAGTAGAPAALFPTGSAGELAQFQAAGAILVAGDYELGYRLYGDRWYRMLNLYAGILAQRIGLAATAAGLGSSLRCDYQVKSADRLIRASAGRTVLLVALIGVERGATAPGHRLMLSGYGS
jgi:SagB-type dehydrogenase family enzyme